MPKPNNALKDRLSRYREIDLSVIGRKSGRTISQPVWFVSEDDSLPLPVRGSDTQWYKNLPQHPSIRMMRAAQELIFRVFLLRIRTKFRRWLEIPCQVWNG